MATQIATSTISEPTISSAKRGVAVLGNGNALVVYNNGTNTVSKEGNGEAALAAASAVTITTGEVSSDAQAGDVFGSAAFAGTVGGAAKYATYAAGAWTVQSNPANYSTAGNYGFLDSAGRVHLVNRTSSLIQLYEAASITSSYTEVDSYGPIAGHGFAAPNGIVAIPWNNMVAVVTFDGSGSLAWVAQRLLTATSGSLSATAVTLIESLAVNNYVLSGCASNPGGNAQNDGQGDAWIAYRDGANLVCRLLVAANDSTMSGKAWSSKVTVAAGNTNTSPACVSDQAGNVYVYWIDTASAPTYAIKRAKLTNNGGTPSVSGTTTIVAGGGTARTFLSCLENQAGSATNYLTYTEGAGSPYSVMVHADTLPATAGFASVTPGAVPVSHAATISLALVGIGTAWGGGTTFTVTNSVSGTTTVAKSSQSVADTTHATLVITTGAGSGTFTISDGTYTSAPITVGAASFTTNPTSLYNNSSTTVTLTGNNTVWSNDTPTFSISGVAGVSISGQSITGNTAATLTIVTGGTTGTATITDPSTGATTTIAVTTGIVLPNDAALLYTPYTWEAATTAHARTVCPGAGMRTHFTGTSVVANFDTAGNSDPTHVQIVYRVDGGPWVVANIASSITMGTGLASQRHLLEIVSNGYSGASQAWALTDPGAVSFTGLTLDHSAVASAPRARKYNILCYGDSVTAGASTGSIAGGAGSSALLSYAQTLGLLIDAEVGQRGFGGAGYSVSNSNGVPALSSCYNLIASGVSLAFSPVPDAIIHFNGHNDSGSVGSVQTAIQTALSGLLSATPTTPQFVFKDFNGIAATAESQAVTAVASSKVTYTDTAGWITTTAGVDTSDGVHPLASAHIAEIAPRIADTIMPVLHPASVPGASRPRHSSC